MSRLTDLLRRVEKQDPDLARDLASEVKTLAARRSFGLNFERHVPETVELPGRNIRRGDKVRFRAPRGESDKGLDSRLWLVTRIEGRGEDRTAHLVEHQAREKPETAQRLTDDLVVVAEFRDPIYPGLKSTGKVERGGDKPWHTVINAENYHALEALMFAHEGEVDCIYIDPPYNTRDKDWKYNNDYVDSDDAYRHSKWLAFMERRLKLAKRLLDPASSVLAVTIDEKEVHRLGLLLDQVFSECTRQMVTVVINPNGVARKSELARVEENLIFVFVGSAGPNLVSDNMLSNDGDGRSRDKVRWEWLLRGGTNSRREDRPNLFYPIYIDPHTRSVAEVGDPIPLEVVRYSVPGRQGLVTVWPLRTNGDEGNWRASAGYLRSLLASGHAKVGAYDQSNDRWSMLYLGKAQIRRIESGEISVLGSDSSGALILQASDASASLVPKTVWNRSSHKAGEYGSALLKKFAPGRVFPFPKSLHLLEDTLRVAIGNKPNAIVLDFFAGSGTTAHAVMRLNRQDSGRRRSIMVTNNEVSNDEAYALRKQGYRPGDPAWEALGICEYITKTRIRSAITGMTPEGEPIRGGYKFTDEFPMAEGFEENVEFFDLTYEDPERVRHDLAYSAIAPLLWMKAGSEGRRIDCPSDTFDIADTYGVLFNIDAASAFVKAARETEGMRVAYIVTDDEKQYQMIADELPRGVQPVRLYEAYLRTFQINTGEA
jgi:adenine-specific DNA-methyltransferase